MRLCTGLLRTAAGLVALWLLFGCESAPAKPPLPPSESDVPLLKSAALCDRKPAFLKQYSVSSLQPHSWGSGQELVLPAAQSLIRADESYFFDENGILVGALFTFHSGLELHPYPVLRRTLSQLRPTLEFYLNVAKLSSKDKNMEYSALYETGDETSTAQYLVLGPRSRPVLLQASFSIDPYVRLFSPYRREFLERLRNQSGENTDRTIDSQGAEDKEPFTSLQQFARGQAAQLSYCGERNYEIAADAYQKAIASGFSNKVWAAEAHHRLGLAFEGLGQYVKAKAEMLLSLSIRPNTPEVLNNLGTVHVKLGDKAAALAAFEKAVTLRPNYAIARYNLAEAYEALNPRRALTEYETFLALAEGIPEEADRREIAKQRVKKLKR